MNEDGPVSSTRVRRTFAAPRERVYRALTTLDQIAAWRFPSDMTCRIDHSEGTSFQVSLTYNEPGPKGKTTARTDTYRGRFTHLEPPEMVVEVDEFVTDDPLFQGAMTITIRLAEADGGTELLAVHEGLPPAVTASDNEAGWSQALDRLADLVEKA